MRQTDSARSDRLPASREPRGPFTASATGFRLALHRPDMPEELREMLAADARAAIQILAQIVVDLEQPIARRMA